MNGANDESRKRNQFGDYEDISNMKPEDWSYRWGKSHTQFHMPKIHPMLSKHYDTLTGQRKNLRIFLPLCGKAVDMKMLSDEGHDVVGLECAEKGCMEFFQEQNIPYTTTDLTECSGKVFKATDNRKLTIYCCDFFKISSKILGQFDCVWDRGSFVAIPVTLRKQYSNVITPMMHSDTIYLMDTFLLDHIVFAGPPFNCTEDHLNKTFGAQMDIKKIDERDAFGEWQRSWGLTSFIEQLYLLKKK
ncbi:probable thiopurine S-methyltransferase [Ostrea edulis]|uniref:probable thiopurine S-methyltransferase n=1 Tax=Ostrea edulis TaxID=37623 RepID=UPI0024AF1550|nr:probable thiopurine S-methyltransferase [Ostrea edulis]XP_048762686.2 probable thiopurine S-methyltransferase [Ostrea edulis]XP_048762687.2 probable thiopurine S-methyltransferase [Ostrea edulis]